MESKHPRESSFCLGHESAKQAFENALTRNRLPHAWLLRGEQGIGKATLAYHLVRRSFAHDDERQACQDPAHPIFRMIAAEAHPDLQILERQKNPRTGKLQKEIVVDAVRHAIEALRNTPAKGRWRVLLVDAVDDLNSNAANALLKFLEEPPADVVILLICHRTAQIPRTILSRCVEMRLTCLSADDTRSVIERLDPAMSPEERDVLISLSNGRPGKVLAWHDEDFLNTYQQLTEAIARAIDGSTSMMQPLDLTHGRARELGIRHSLEPLILLVRRIALHRAAAVKGGEVFDGEYELLGRLAARAALDHWSHLWERLLQLGDQVEHLNLDIKQALLLGLSAFQGPATARAT